MKIQIVIAGFIILLLAVGCTTPVSTHEDGTASFQQLDTAKITAVKARLSQDKILAGEALKVTVINSECTLEGTVPTEEAKQMAEKFASGVEGITKVNNKLTVTVKEE